MVALYEPAEIADIGAPLEDDVASASSVIPVILIPLIT
jgi:hypothetical protein